MRRAPGDLGNRWPMLVCGLLLGVGICLGRLPGSAKSSGFAEHLLAGKLGYVFGVAATNLDADGDIDIAATGWSKGDRVVWFENAGDGRWTRHVVRTDFRAANQVILADLDGDKRLDIVAGADDGSRRVQGSLELRWWRNRLPKRK